MEVGVIGVGRMGKAMARNLLKAGHKLHVFDMAKEPLRELAKEGAAMAASAKDAFGGDAVISMLPNDDAMRAVFVDGDVLAGGRQRDHSRQYGDRLGRLRGRADGAAQGARRALRGRDRLGPAGRGDRRRSSRSQWPVMPKRSTARSRCSTRSASRTTRVGDEPRMANVAKIAGNLLVASAIEAMGEAAALVRGYGMSAPDFLDLIVTALFEVPVYRGYAEQIGSGVYEPPGFDMKLGFKDVRLALAAAEKANVPLPFASVLRDAFLDALAHGDANKDWAAIAKVAARRAGLEN